MYHETEIKLRWNVYQYGHASSINNVWTRYGQPKVRVRVPGEKHRPAASHWQTDKQCCIE